MLNNINLQVFIFFVQIIFRTYFSLFLKKRKQAASHSQSTKKSNTFFCSLKFNKTHHDIIYICHLGSSLWAESIIQTFELISLKYFNMMRFLSSLEFHICFWKAEYSRMHYSYWQSFITLHMDQYIKYQSNNRRTSKPTF